MHRVVMLEGFSHVGQNVLVYVLGNHYQSGPAVNHGVQGLDSLIGVHKHLVAVGHTPTWYSPVSCGVYFLRRHREVVKTFLATHDLGSVIASESHV